MKQITFIISLFLLVSCNTQQVSLNTNEVNKRPPSTEYLYAEDLFYLAIAVNIDYFEQLEEELIGEYENGNEAAHEQYLEVQQTLENLNSYNNILLEMNRPLRPGGVIPFPPPTPLPCDEPDFAGLNCQPIQDFTNIREIVSEGFGEIEILFQQKDHIVGENIDFGEDVFGQRTVQVATDFEGEAIMYSTVQFEKLPEITIMTPVFID